MEAAELVEEGGSRSAILWLAVPHSEETFQLTIRRPALGALVR